MNWVLRLLLTLLETWHMLTRRWRRIGTGSMSDDERAAIVARLRADVWKDWKEAQWRWGPSGDAKWFADAEQRMQQKMWEIIQNSKRRA